MNREQHGSLPNILLCILSKFCKTLRLQILGQRVMYLISIKVLEESPTSIFRIVFGSPPRSLAHINQTTPCLFPHERNLDIIGKHHKSRLVTHISKTVAESDCQFRYVCLSECIRATPTGVIFVKFYIWSYYSKSVIVFRFCLMLDNYNRGFTCRAIYVYNFPP